MEQKINDAMYAVTNLLTLLDSIGTYTDYAMHLELMKGSSEVWDKKAKAEDALEDLIGHIRNTITLCSK